MKAKSVFTTSLQSWLQVVRQLFFHNLKRHLTTIFSEFVKDLHAPLHVQNGLFPHSKLFMRKAV